VIFRALIAAVSTLVRLTGPAYPWADPVLPQPEGTWQRLSGGGKPGRDLEGGAHV
jgi:hypothetical protein